MSEKGTPTSKEVMESTASPPTTLHSRARSDVERIGDSHVIHEKPFSLLSLLGVAFSCSNAPITLLASLAAGISSGGPAVFVYGTILVGIASGGVACSLAELASAYPHAGGQYYWVSQLAGDRYRRPLSYLVAFLSWAGAIVTCASAMLTIPLMIIGMYSLNHPDLVIKPWMVFVGYQVTNIFCAFFNCFERILPKIATANLSLAVVGAVVIFITMLATSPTKQSGEFVFATFVNNSGYSSNGVTFLTGMLAANWGFTCMDSITHLADEVPRPEKNIPKALIAVVLLGIATSFPMAIATFFSVQSLDDVIATPTGLPSLELFYQALGSIKGAIALECIMCVNFICAGISIQTWQSRMAWALARDQGWPFAERLSRIAPTPFDVPLWAHLWSSIWVAILGCLYLGSTAAFNSFIGGGLLLQYISYSIPIVVLLIHGRDNVTPGPFWLPRMGPVCNYITIAWTLLTTVFYSFPAIVPTTASTMNYVSVVLVFMFIYSGVFWLAQGRKRYVTPAKLD